MRDYGFGRRFESLENEIKDEIMGFVNLIKEGPQYEHEKVRNFQRLPKYKKDLTVSTIFVLDPIQTWRIRSLSKSIFRLFRKLLIASFVWRAFRSP